MIRNLLAGLVLCFLAFSTNAQIVAVPILGSPLTLNVVANPQPLQNLYQNPAATNITMADDAVRNVPLPFTFPYFGQNFNNSWMYSNGAISFQGPNATYGFCCSGQSLNPGLDSSYNYSILPLWTDLIASNNRGHFVLGTNNTMTYGWYNVTEYGNSQLNSFEVKIDSTGAIDMRYAGTFVSLNHEVTIGLVGNAQNGEFYQYYYGRGLNLGLTQLSFVSDPCLTNPLYSPTCSGYQEAYTQQQCFINPLYSPVCPGYAQAFYEQQCSISALYDSTCPGYAQAYQDKLISDACKANPQSSPTCAGYQITAVASSPTVMQEITAIPNTVSVIASPTVQSTITPSAAASTATNPTTPIAQATNSQSSTAAVVQTVTATSSQTETKTVENKPQSTPASERKVASTSDAKKQANERAKEATGEMKSATTMEAQVAAQNTVIGLMGYTPGFGAYQTAIIPDSKQLEMARQYHKDSVDNRSALRQLNGASDRRWSEMVEGQYRITP